MFIPTLNRRICEDFSKIIITARRIFTHIVPPRSIARYSFIQLSELECRGENGNAQVSTELPRLMPRLSGNRAQQYIITNVITNPVINSSHPTVTLHTDPSSCLLFTNDIRMAALSRPWYWSTVFTSTSTRWCSRIKSRSSRTCCWYGAIIPISPEETPHCKDNDTCVATHHVHSQCCVNSGIS